MFNKGHLREFAMIKSILTTSCYIILTCCSVGLANANQSYQLNNGSIQKTGCAGLDVDVDISSINFDGKTLTLQEPGKSARVIRVINHVGYYTVNRSSPEAGYQLTESIRFIVSGNAVSTHSIVNFTSNDTKIRCKVSADYFS